MHFICYDFETTGRNSNWDQIIQVGAVLTNETLDEIDFFEISCSLKPGTIPEPEALMVNETIPRDDGNVSHYSLVKLMWQKFTYWVNAYKPIAFIGYNSVNFDEEFLRRTLYKNLFPPFLTTTHTFGVPSKRGDIINLARMANVFSPGTFKTTFNEKGREVYKLDQLAIDNIALDSGKELKFHDALDDARATIEIAKIIKTKAPDLWSSGLKTMTKNGVVKFINEEEFFISSEFYFGTLRHYVVTQLCDNPKGPFKVFDLRNDPSQFVGLQYEELKKIIRETKPKVIRSIYKQKHPILMPKEFIKSVEGYSQINYEELKRRAQFIRENVEINSQFRRLIFEEIEKENDNRELDQSDKEPEECIYDFGFASIEEKKLMMEFHDCDWQRKLEIADEFQNLRKNDDQASQRGRIYSEFAKLIVYEESSESLSEPEKQKIRKKLADRIFYEDTGNAKSPWNNIERAYMQIQALGNKFEDEGQSQQYKLLKKIEQLVENIENRFLDLKS